MRVLVHMANLHAGGGLQVALSLLEEFAALPALETGIIHAASARPFIAQLPGRPATFEVPESPTRSLSDLARFRRAASKAEKSFRPDVALTVFGPGLWRPSVPHLVGFANGLYLFSDSDFIRRQWPQGFSARLRYHARRRVLLQQLRREADLLWVETEAAAQKLASALRIAPVSIKVVPNTASRHFREAVVQDTDVPGDKDWFDLLTFYAAHPNKNLDLIARLLPLVAGTDVRFLVTLPEDRFRAIFKEQAGSPHLRNLGIIDPARGPEVYRQADAVFLPSLLETFSATYPEAMAMGKPILASDRPFARSICGEAALYFDPLDVRDALRCILQLREDQQLREELAARGKAVFSSMSTPAQRAERIVAILGAMNVR